MDIPVVGLVCAWVCRIISVTLGVCVREQEAVNMCVYEEGVHNLICNHRSLIFCVSPTHSHVSASVNQPPVSRCGCFQNGLFSSFFS